MFVIESENVNIKCHVILFTDNCINRRKRKNALNSGLYSFAKERGTKEYVSMAFYHVS